MNILDLHMHSSYSRDADFTPAQLIEKAKAAHLQCIALSDHNDMAGVDAMIQLGKEAGIEVIPAIEFDTMFEGLEVHLLGYNFDYNKPYYQELAQSIIQLMDDATHRRIEAFKAHFKVELDEDEIRKDTPEGGNPFFTICDKMLNDPNNAHIPAFQDYLPGGSRCNPQTVNFFWDQCSAGQPCYVKVDFPDFTQTCQRIHDDGGIAVLAHPWKAFYQQEALLQKALEAGIDGIEVYSNYHTDEHNEFYRSYCTKNNVLMTCGSDFHGMMKSKIVMGESGCPLEQQRQIMHTFKQALDTKKRT